MVYPLGVRVRISDEISRTVVFIGYPTQEPGKGGIDCIGTAFLLKYEDCPYLVTVRHVAEYVGNEPFLIRVNRHDGGADNLPIDGAAWYYDANPDIDVAVLPFDFVDEREHSVRFVDDKKESWWSNKAWKYGVGIGDFCYTVGLFRVLAGNKQNLPVVHFGTIARKFYGDSEPIPIRDWRDHSGKKAIMTDAYLVQSQSLSGLSGAPVFVRVSNQMIRQELIDHNPHMPIDELGDAVAQWHIHLIGVWQGAWDAPPGEVLSAERGESVRVPVGMGVVVPIDHVHYILASEELTKMRKNVKMKRSRRGMGKGA
jgi:hypothetical protein